MMSIQTGLSILAPAAEAALSGILLILALMVLALMLSGARRFRHAWDAADAESDRTEEEERLLAEAARMEIAKALRRLRESLAEAERLRLREERRREAEKKLPMMMAAMIGLGWVPPPEIRSWMAGDILHADAPARRRDASDRSVRRWEAAQR
jgi:hypothetical protein